MKLRSLLALASILLLLFAVDAPPARADPDKKVTIYVVRHAETDRTPPKSKDPPLSERGVAQAAELRDFLLERGVDAVFSTDYRRTRSTAAPTAEAIGKKTLIYRPMAIGQEGGLPDRSTLIWRYQRSAILIVGHSNTAPQILAALGYPSDIRIAEDEHDNLFVVQLNGDETLVRRHRIGPLKRLDRFVVTGAVGGGAAMGGAAVVDGGVVTCAGAAIQQWKRDEGELTACARVDLPTPGNATEGFALEGLTVSGNHAFPVGSRTLFRVAIVDGAPQAETVRTIDLGPTLAKHQLRPAVKAPSKEKVKIGAIAALGDDLYLGQRSPVLRGGLAAVVRVRPSAEFDSIESHALVLADFDGRGVCGMTRLGTGFLVIAGPAAKRAVGVGPSGYRLYHWDGRTMQRRTQPDAEPAPGRTTLLGTIPATDDAVPTGLAILAESEAELTILVVHDGPADGAPTAYRVRRLPGL